MKQMQLTGSQARSLLAQGEVEVRKPVRPGRGQSWLTQAMIDAVKQVEFEGGEWLVLKHPHGEGNLTCIRNIAGKVGELRAHRTLTMLVVKVAVERTKSWEWVIRLRLVQGEAPHA